jgi:hypothetical protein
LETNRGLWEGDDILTLWLGDDSIGDGRPESPSFSQTDTTGINGSSFFSPIPPPNFGTPPGTPSRSPSFGLYVDSPDSPSASPFGRLDDNPFLAPRQKARFEMDYLSESQWYSDYPHHLTVEYLDEVFNMEKRGRRLPIPASYEVLSHQRGFPRTSH